MPALQDILLRAMTDREFVGKIKQSGAQELGLTEKEKEVFEKIEWDKMFPALAGIDDLVNNPDSTIKQALHSMHVDNK